MQPPRKPSPGKWRNPKSIEKNKLLLVEGNDEVKFFTSLTKFLNIDNDIQIVEAGGKDQFVNVFDVIKNG